MGRLKTSHVCMNTYYKVPGELAGSSGLWVGESIQ